MGYAQDMALEKYPPGTDIQMLESHDPEGAIPKLWRGTVLSVTPEGLLMVRWWDSSRLSKVDIARDAVDTA